MKGAKNMKKYNIGFIGSGKMAGAIIKGLLKTDFIQEENILATQAETSSLRFNGEEEDVMNSSDRRFLATESSDIENDISFYRRTDLIPKTSRAFHHVFNDSKESSQYIMNEEEDFSISLSFCLLSFLFIFFSSCFYE